MNVIPHATNTLPLPPKRRHRRKYSLPGTEAPPRYLLGPKPDLKDADSSEIDKSDKSDISLSERVSFSDLSITDSGIMSNSSTVKSLSLTVPCVSESFFNPRLLRNTVRPLSLDLSYQSEQTYSKSSSESILNTASSTTNSLPLPPRRRRERIYSLQGDEPPPRSLLGPKPAKFQILSADFKTSSENEGSKLSMDIIPIIEVTKDAEIITGYPQTAKDNDIDDNLSLDDVFIENVVSEARVETAIDSLSNTDEGSIKFIDDASPESTDIETRASATGNLDSDVESQKSVPVERSDTDSHFDIHSESSVDTVATAIEVRDRSTTIDSTDALNLTDDNMFVIHNPSYESLNTYELLSTDGKLSVIDESNPKLAKDLKNKMSKESTQRLSKNLAAEITDFFKSSASKLKPPCLDQPKKDIANKKHKVDHDVVESSLKTPQRLIPRSPYITPVPLFEQKILPRKAPSVKQPPFYVWNINSKNAAVCTTLNPSTSHRNAPNEESKTMKDIENNTKKYLELNKRTDGGNGNRVDSTKTTEKDAKSASTGQLATKPQRDSKMTHAQSNDLKPKPRTLASKNKTIAKLRPSPNRLVVPKASQCDSSPTKPLHSKTLKCPTKNVPKINIPLPSPHITVAKVQTQLPCDFTPSTVCNNVHDPCTSTSESNNLPNVTIPHAPAAKKSWVKKWKSVIQDIFRKHHVEFYIDGVPPCYNFKRFNTWPPKANECEDDTSIYMRFK